jgi:glycosyltransferase involved in cell wall biosynthesis
MISIPFHDVMSNGRMKIILFTHTYPLEPYGEASFLHNEIDYVSRNFQTLGITDFILVPMSVSSYPSKNQMQLPPNISIDYSFVHTRRTIRRYRKILVVLLSLMNIKKVFVSRSTPLRSLRSDLFSLMTWVDNHVVMKKVLTQERFLELINGSLCYTYWADGYTDALGKFLERDSKENLNARVVTRAHGGDVLDDQILQVDLQRRFKGVLRIFTTSDYLSRYLASKGVKKDLLLVSRLGVSVSDIESSTESSIDNLLSGFDSVRHQLMISISSSHPVKRLDRLRDVLESCSSNGFPVFWLHIGASLIDTSSVNGDFVMNSMTHVPHEDVLKILKSLRHAYSPIFINFSLSEGVPISAVEAGMLGIPIVATAAGGTPTLFEVSSTGLLSINPSESELRRHLSSIQKSYDLISGATSNRMKYMFSPEHTFESFYSCLKSIAP